MKTQKMQKTVLEFTKKEFLALLLEKGLPVPRDPNNETVRADGKWFVSDMNAPFVSIEWEE